MVQLNDEDRKGLATLVKPPLKLIRHKAKDRKNPTAVRRTVVRPICEIAYDGALLPMVIAGAGENLDYSALASENITLYAGMQNKYTGLGQCSDVPNQPDIEQVFPGLYIRLTGRSKKGQLSQAVDYAYLKAKARNGNAPEALSRPARFTLMQCVVLEYDGKQLPKALPFHVLMLSKMATSALNKTLIKAHASGVDVFSPENGHVLIFDSIAAESDDAVPTLTCELGPKMPLTVEVARKLWTPWSTALVRDTYATQIQRACACFGEPLVAEAFPVAVARHCGAAAQEVSQGQQPAPAQYATPAPAPAPAQVPPVQVPAAIVTAELDFSADITLDAGDDAPAAAQPAAQPAPPAQNLPAHLQDQTAAALSPGVGATQGPAQAAVPPDPKAIEADYLAQLNLDLS